MSVNNILIIIYTLQNGTSIFAKILIFAKQMYISVSYKTFDDLWKGVPQNRCTFLLVGDVFKYQAWYDMREWGASLTMFEFAVALGWNCFSKEMYSFLPFETRRLLYWLCFAKGGTPSSFEAFSECGCKVLRKRGVHPLSKTDNCRVPLFHYFAANLHNRLNCLADEISMSRMLLSYAMAYLNLMAVILIETDQNRFFVFPVKFWNWRHGCPHPFCITPLKYCHMKNDCYIINLTHWGRILYVLSCELKSLSWGNKRSLFSILNSYIMNIIQ